MSLHDYLNNLDFMALCSPPLRNLLAEQDVVTKRVIAEHFRNIEEQLVGAVCDKLADRGRIIPGEPLLDVPDWYGVGGKTRYYFP